jgi:hypothetical protein
VTLIGVTLPFLIIGGGAATWRSQDIESSEEGKDSRVLMRVQPMQGTSTAPLVVVFPCNGRRGGVTGGTVGGRSGKRKGEISSGFALFIGLQSGSVEVRKGERLRTQGPVVGEEEGRSRVLGY